LTVGPLRHLGGIDAGQPDRQAVGTLLDADGVAVTNREDTGGLAEIQDRMTARAFEAVHNPEQGPEVRQVLGELLAVLDRTSADGVI
jgi:hypothetical protein